MNTITSDLDRAIKGVQEVESILNDPQFADRVSVAGQAAQALASQIKALQQTLASARLDCALRNIHPCRAFASVAGFSAALASGGTILNAPIGVLAGSIGLGGAALLAGGASVVGGAVGGGFGYGIHKGVEAIQGKSIGENWYDSLVSARTFSKWTTEAEIGGHHVLDVSGWF